MWDNVCPYTMKVSHRTKAEADEALTMLRGITYNKKGRYLNVYPCFRCGGWHVGNKLAKIERYERGYHERRTV